MNEIRDAIYGFITPNDTEMKIINTPVFQRLRRIRQLAMAYLVYPGANHTRFEHSLGVYHVAHLIADKLLPGDDNDERRRLVRLAALLHDIGHGPFSHTSEDLLHKFASNSGNPKDENKIHELITARLIENDEGLADLLSPQDKENVIGLLQSTKVDLTLMKHIVSGPLDADKMDYLLRDSHFCGVKYGVFDLDRVINTIDTYEDKHDRDIAIKHDGINSLEQFVLAKYYMITQVYFHKVRRVSDAMIVRGIELGIERDNLKLLKSLFCYEDSNEYLSRYLTYWDDRLVAEIMDSKSRYAKDYFDRLYHRRLFKKVFSRKLDEFNFSSELMHDKILDIQLKDNARLKKELEQEISGIRLLECEKEYVIFNCVSIKSVKEMSRDSEGSIVVQNENGKLSSFEQESTVFRAIDESLKDIYVEVYAPIEYTDYKDKQEKLSLFREEITKILEERER
ncbi:MAG: HD domain-containing protein [Chloroflexota bacterium]|nr:HD domain-containing protein [Chloroflexota bacterium]